MLFFKCTDGYTLVYEHVLFIPLIYVCFGGVPLINLINLKESTKYTDVEFSAMWLGRTHICIWSCSDSIIHLYKASGMENYFHQGHQLTKMKAIEPKK